MTVEEYRNKLDILQEDHRLKKQALDKDFVWSNSTAKVGDIVEDHMGKIIVESIKYGFATRDGIPQAVYIGTVLTKADTPSKRGKKRQVWQWNIVT